MKYDSIERYFSYVVI